MMFGKLATASLVVLFSPISTLAAAPPAEVTDGLIAHYSFDAVDGDQIKDVSGNSNGATWKGRTGSEPTPDGAILLDGVDDYLEVGTALSESLHDAVTVEIACRPTEARGGIFSFAVGAGWADLRFVLATNTYNGVSTFLANVADGTDYAILAQPEAPRLGEWVHYVMVADGKTFRLYRDGLLFGSAALAAPVDVKGAPLWIGRSPGLGHEYFAGEIGDVRVYKRGLANDEVLSLFKRHSAAKGLDVSRFDRPSLAAILLDEPGWIIAHASAGYQLPIPENAVMLASLRRAGEQEAIAEERAALSPTKLSVQPRLDATELPAGEYEVRARVISPDGKPMGEEASLQVSWPGRSEKFAGIRVLNNLVWELAAIKDRSINGREEMKFQSPKSRWVLICCDAELNGRDTLAFSLDGGKSSVLDLSSLRSKSQTMRYLPAGEHVLAMQSQGNVRIRELIVRSVPELIYSEYQSEPWVAEFRPYMGTFLEKHILPNVNTMVIGNWAMSEVFVGAWRQRGGRWLTHVNVPGLHYDGLDTGAQLKEEAEAYGFLTKTAGYADPRVDGAIADEFGDSEPHCALYAAAIRKAATAPEFKGKLFYPYANAMYNGPEGRDLIQAVLETDSAIAWKNYLPTQPDEASARHYIKSELIDRANQYRTQVPGSVEHLVVTFGYFSAPPEFLNIHPEVNYKTYLDMQFNAVANDPAFWGCYGLMTYLASYADEETVRWSGELFRHYGMEGNTAAVTDDPYVMDHLSNGDFAEGTQGWTISAAADDGVRLETRAGLGWLEGRYPRTTVGDTAIVLKRNESRPNAISQEVRNLEPGKFYLLRAISADANDLSIAEMHAVRIHIDGATILPEKTFTSLQANCYSHHFGPFNDKNRAYFNYHWTVFRADQSTATLTILDWQTDDVPGGNIGQELLLNYIQVSPYFQH